MNLWCALCGQKGNKSTMLVSRGTGNAYCRDEIECGRRQTVRRALRTSPNHDTRTA